ncbi:MAG: carboxyl transferase domain-containing protein [Myxococcota bacterium]
MDTLQSRIQTQSDEFKSNAAHHRGLAATLRERLAKVSEGGPPRAHETQRKRGKLHARERIEKLLDPDTPFLEVGALAAWDRHDNAVPSAGMVAGVGRIYGRECMIVANDSTVKGGTYFPETIKKHIRAQEIALENRLPTIYLVDSGGVFLPMQSEVFPDKEHFGRIFYNQAQMSAAGIPQIACVVGMCTAGGAYVPAMSDENVIVKGSGTIYLAGPPLVKAATGEEVTPEDLGGGEMHSTVSGVTDHLAENEEEAFRIVRNIVENLNTTKRVDLDLAEPEEPLYEPSELYGILPTDNRHPYDVHEVLARLLDGSRFHEFKANYGTTIVCGFGRWMGYPVGIVANNGVIFSESALKAAHFVELCNQRRVPLIFLQNITGFMVGKRYEQGGIAKDGAKMVQAVATATVPKITVIIGASHGAGNYAMCGRGYLPRFLFTWPNSRVGVMGAEQAAKVLVTVQEAKLARDGKTLSPEEEQQITEPVMEKYETEGDPYYGTSLLWDDGIIDPAHTREVIALALSAALNAPVRRGEAPVYRM